MPEYTLEDLQRLAGSGQEQQEVPVQSDPMQYVSNKLHQDYGWSPEVSAGIVGNLFHESELKGHVWGDRGASYGLAQWNGPRRKALADYATQAGKPVDDLDTQIEFLNYELLTDYSNVADRLRKVKSAAEATRIFSQGYEKPGTVAMGSRLSATKKAYGLIDRIMDVLGPGEAEAAPAPATGKFEYTAEDLKKIASGETGKREYTVADLQKIAGQASTGRAKVVAPVSPDLLKPIVEGVREIGESAKEMVFGKPRSIMIPEERYQEGMKEFHGVDVHPGWTKPLEQIGSQLRVGLKGSVKSLVDWVNQYSDNPYSKKFGKSISEWLTTPPEMVGEDLASKVIQSLGAAPVGVVEYGAAMELGGPAGLAALEAVKAPEGSTWKERTGKAAGGALLGGAFKATGGLPMAPRIGTMGAIGGGQAAVEGGDTKDITASALTMMILATPGGRKLKEAVDTDTKPPDIGPKEWENIKETISRIPPERTIVPEEAKPVPEPTPQKPSETAVEAPVAPQAEAPPVVATTLPASTERPMGAKEEAPGAKNYYGLTQQDIDTIPVSPSGKKLLDNLSMPTADFVKWFKEKKPEYWGTAKLSTFTDGEPYFYLPGIEKAKISQSDYLKDIGYREKPKPSKKSTSTPTPAKEGVGAKKGTGVATEVPTPAPEKGREVVTGQARLPRAEGVAEAAGKAAPALSPAVFQSRDTLAKEKGAKPEDLQYIGDMETAPGKGLHQFNIMDPEHPQFKSTVSAKIGEVPEKVLPAKEQKKYALNAIDEALNGPFKSKGGADHVVIDIPGDGEFKIFNDKKSLEQIKQNFKNFPVSEKKSKDYETKPIKGQKPTVTRSALDNIEDLEYYSPKYTPKKSILEVKEGESTWQNGYYSTGNLLIKMPGKPKGIGTENLKWQSKEVSLKDYIEKTFALDATLSAEIDGEFKPLHQRQSAVIIKSGDVRKAIPAKFMDMIYNEHPNAKPYLSTNEDRPVVFKVNNKPVAAAAGFTLDKKQWGRFDELRGEEPTPEKKGGGKKSLLEDETGAVSLAPIQAVVEDTVNIIREAPRQTKAAYEWIKDASKRAWNWYKSPFDTKERGFKKLLGEYLGARQIAGFENNQFLKKIQSAVPNKVSREGITNWIQAGGDEAVLMERANNSKGSLKNGYEAALKLTPEEKAIAAEISTQFDNYLKEAQAAGIIESGLENYVNQLWEKKTHNKEELKQFKSEINAGLLNTNFNYAKKRIFESYYKGEQKGYIPKNKDIAFLLGTYHQSMYEAIAARRAIKALSDGVAEDGRPLVSVSGGGKHGEYDMTEAKGPEAYFIRPKVKSEETSDYRYINHPALRKWKWVENDANGKPILLQGDMYVHPEIFKHLRNVLGKSVISEHPVGKAALTVSQNLKGVLLSGLPTPFHQVHLGSHALFHKINPFTCPELNFKDPIQRKAVEHGLMVYNHNALADFTEGLQPTGISRKIPGIGRVTQAYGEYLFQDLIPRLKMKLFKEAYERNTKRYEKKYTDNQIAEITANQANAAFGELNYKAMGRNPTMQDMFRLLALAPDFLEARLRFAGQAIKPGGKEQSTALLRGIIGMYGVGIIGNMLFSDDKKPHWDKPFQVIIGDKAYSMRSVPGDMIHLFGDPRSFVYHRLNPSTLKPGVEALFQRDIYGRKRTIGEQAGDYFKGVVPIPLQHMVSEGERTLLQSALQVVGGTSWKNKSSLDKIMQEYFESRAMLNLSPEDREISKIRRQAQELVRQGKEDKAIEKLQEGVEKGKVDAKKASSWIMEARKPAKESQFSKLPLDWQAKALLKATPEEEDMLMPILIKHLKTAKPEMKKKAVPFLEQLIEKRQSANQ